MTELKNKKELELLIMEAEDKELPLIVDVWAPWCGPCKSFAKVFANAAETEPACLWAKMEFDAAEEYFTELGVRSLPTILCYNPGHSGPQPILRVGSLSSEDLLTYARGHE